MMPVFKDHRAGSFNAVGFEAKPLLTWENVEYVKRPEFSHLFLLRLFNWHARVFMSRE